MKLIPLTALLALFVGSGCAFVPVHTVASNPTPNVIAAGRARGTFAIDVSHVPADEICSKQAGLRDLCVKNLRGSFQAGLHDVISGYLKEGPGGYTAEFKVLGFSHSFASAGRTTNPAVAVSLKWQFVLRDAAGAPVVQMASTTYSPEPIVDIGGADDVVHKLIDRTLEDVGAKLNDSKFWSAPAENPATAAR